MIEVKKKDNESPAGVLFRFTKRVRQSGVLVELRKRRFHNRAVNKRKRKVSAIFRSKKRSEMARLKKLGAV
ncbi:MAG: 30S ribosomal protein S21 [Candidatus Liptonbacteria bacterium]